MPARGLPRRLKSPGTVFALAAIFLGAVKSFFILRRFKPDIIIGSGGYAAAPVLLAAALLKKAFSSTSRTPSPAGSTCSSPASPPASASPSPRPPRFSRRQGRGRRAIRCARLAPAADRGDRAERNETAATAKAEYPPQQPRPVHLQRQHGGAHHQPRRRRDHPAPARPAQPVRHPLHRQGLRQGLQGLRRHGEDPGAPGLPAPDRRPAAGPGILRPHRRNL